MRACLLGVILTIAMGCQQNEKHSAGGVFVVQQNNETIVGGRYAEENKDDFFYSVVMLVEQVGELKYRCTGTLIAEDIILTASHCVKQAHKDPSSMKVMFLQNNLSSENQSVQKAEFIEIQVQKALIDPDYDAEKKWAGHDLALLRLKEKAPPEALPIRLAGYSTNFPEESSYIVAGYGRTSANAKLPDESPTALRTTEVNLDADYLDPKNAKVIIFNQKDKKGVCSGDSGGPAFLKTSSGIVQVGVSSSVSYRIIGEECYGSSRSMNVFQHREWLHSAFAELKPRTWLHFY